MSIERCREGDVAPLMELFKGIYAHNPRLQERDYFEWQFRNSPFNAEGDYTLWVQRKNGDISSFLGYVPLEVRHGGVVHGGCWLMNWHSLNRDGAALGLLSKVMEGHDCRFMLGITQEAARIYEALKIPILDCFPRWVGVLDAEKAAELFEIRDGADKRALRESARRLGSLSASGGLVDRVGRFADEEEFLPRGFKTVDGWVRRTGRFLNWRYADIPRHSYRMLRGAGGQFAVYRVETITGRRESAIRILEWWAWDEWRKNALSAILEDGRRENAVILDFFCFSGEVGGRLEDLGFMGRDSFRGRPIPYLFRPLHRADEIVSAIDAPPHRNARDADFGRWYITKGDGDLDRVKL
ncbi:MAG: hypothetical protein HY921_02755 [Elusimicrobia bacterium]|nr:hypothetical protein [Elusimicrobiota bacterium]